MNRGFLIRWFWSFVIVMLVAYSCAASGCASRRPLPIAGRMPPCIVGETPGVWMTDDGREWVCISKIAFERWKLRNGYGTDGRID